MDSAEKPKGLKARLFSALDPAAKQEKIEAQKRAQRAELSARQEKITAERDYRSEARAGKRSASTGGYIKSIIREKNESRKVRGLEENLMPQLKAQRKQDREIKNIESRQKWRKRFNKVDGVFDSINAGFDKVDGGLNGKGKGKGSSGFGMSEKDLNELSGLGGSSRKGKSNGGGMGFGFEFGGGSGFSQAEMNELAGLGGGRKSSSGGTKRRKKATTHHKKAHRRTSTTRSRSIFDIDI